MGISQQGVNQVLIRLLGASKFISDKAEALGITREWVKKYDSIEHPQERIAQRLGISRDVVSNHLRKSSEMKNSVNSQLERGFGVNTIAEKLGWPEPLVWAVARILIVVRQKSPEKIRRGNL